MSQPLLATRRFAPLFWCQFFAAFNDNFLKNALVLFILFRIGGEAGASLVTLAGVVLMAPHFLLSALGGQLADKFDKSTVARRIKLVEIAAAGVAVAGFWTNSVELLFVALFLFGALGALFAPVKYGILPDCLAREELPAGNALVEAATFLAILAGTIAGGLAMEGGGDLKVLAGGMMGFALASYAAAWFIPATARAAPELRIDPNIIRSTFVLLRELWRETKLWRLGVVTSIFWLIGAVVMSLLPSLVTQTLHGADQVVTIHLAVFAIAIGVGSGLSAFLLHGKIVLLPAAVGAAIVGLVSIDLGVFLALRDATTDAALLEPAAYFAQPGAWRAAIDLALLSIAGGLIVVPVLRRASGVFGAGGARPRHRRRQRAQRRLHGRGRDRRRGLASQGRAGLVAVRRRRRDRARFVGLDRQGGGRLAVSGHIVDLLSRGLPARSEGPGESRKGGRESDHRAQPCQLSRRGAGAVDSAGGADLRHRQRHRQGVVGEALPEAHPRGAARPDQTHGDAHAGQRRQGRGHSGDLSRRAPHRHRQSDEGL